MDREQTAGPVLPPADDFEAPKQLAPAERVPDDILFDIFAILKQHTPVGSWTNIGAIQLTHVCHRWRVAARALPALWVDIFVGKEEKAKHFLRHSRSCPIAVIAELMVCKPLETAARILWPHMHRIRDLTLQVGPSGASACECARWWMTFPFSGVLKPQGLTLNGFSFHAGIEYPGLFDHNASWTSMALVRIDHASGSLSPTPRLTRLELDGERIRLPCHAILAALRGCPSLKGLTLRSLTGSVTRGIRIPARSIALAELAELKIIRSPALVVPFLRHLDLPLTTRVTMDPADCAALAEMRTALPALERVGRVEAMIEGGRGSPRCSFFFYQEDNADWSLRLGVGAAPWPDFASLCDARGVAELTVHDHAGFVDGRVKWEGMLADMRGLRELRVCRESGAYARAAKHVPLDAVPDEGLAAALRRLSFEVRDVYMRGSVVVVKLDAQQTDEA